MNKVVVRTKSDKARALYIIEEAPLEPVLEVIIKAWKESRSIRQNALYWQWLTLIGPELGNTKDEMHEEYKGRFLTKIFIRDDDAYAAMWEAVREVWRAGMKDKAELLKKEITKLTSTTQTDTKQMAEYMHEVDMHAAGLNIHLPRPDDPRDLTCYRVAA